MMKALRKSHNRLVGLPATRWMLELGAMMLRTETELIVKSRRVIPERLLNEGFRFQHTDFRSAIDSLEQARLSDCA